MILWSCLGRPEKLIRNKCYLPSGLDALVRGLWRRGCVVACLGDAGESVGDCSGLINLGYT